MEARVQDRRLLLAAAGIGAGLAYLLYARSGAAQQVFEVHRQLWIDAPVDEVFRFWRRVENLPGVMPHLLEVEDLGGGRSRWATRGPAGLPVRWCAITTHVAPNEAISWISEPGSLLRNSGRVRFTPEDGGTRIDVRLSYHPPGGLLGELAAHWLGTDPTSRVEEDLDRLKTLFETGEADAAGRTVTREELQPEIGVQGV